MSRLRPLVLTIAFVAPGIAASTASAQLLVDFNSTTQDGGPTNQAGFQAYDAAHEDSPSFVTVNYSAFGTTVSVTPDWPDTTDSRVEQMIDRAAGNDANWTGSMLDLVTDWIGIDTRTANGGNGNFDGATGTPTRFTLTLGGLPAAPYTWTSFHHDTEHVHTPFTVELSTNGGGSFSSIGSFQMTDSTPAGSPDSGNPIAGPDPYALSSTVAFGFEADGANDVQIRFTPLSDATGVHRQIWGMNGFDLQQIPEPSAFLLGLAGLAGLALRRRR